MAWHEGKLHVMLEFRLASNVTEVVLSQDRSLEEPWGEYRKDSAQTKVLVQ